VGKIQGGPSEGDLLVGVKLALSIDSVPSEGTIRDNISQHINRKVAEHSRPLISLEGTLAMRNRMASLSLVLQSRILAGQQPLDRLSIELSDPKQRSSPHLLLPSLCGRYVTLRYSDRICELGLIGVEAAQFSDSSTD
jgi:hypothetical protein